MYKAQNHLSDDESHQRNSCDLNDMEWMCGCDGTELSVSRSFCWSGLLMIIPHPFSAITGVNSVFPFLETLSLSFTDILKGKTMLYPTAVVTFYFADLHHKLTTSS